MSHYDNIMPHIMTYLPREITKQVVNALEDMPVVALTGMRQTGKSTFLQEQPEFKGRKYITLDDFAQFAAAMSPAT